MRIAEANDTGLTRLTNEPTEDNDVAWSPDGPKLAFISNRAGFDAVYRMNVDGSAPTRLTNGPNDSNFAVWKPK